MSVLLVILSLLVAGVSILFVSEATTGVWMMGGAAVLGILARVAQASAQHGEVMAALRRQTSMLENQN